MTKLIARFAAMAHQRPQQIALITERSQMTRRDILAMLHVIDTQLAARGVRPGQTVILDSARAEFTVVFALLLSLRGLRVVFSPVAAVLEGGIAFDWAVGPEPMLALPPERQIIMDAGWFAGLAAVEPPDYRDAAGPEGAFVNRTSGSTGRPKFVLSTEGQQLDRLETRHSFFAARMEDRRVAITTSPSNVWGLTAALSVLVLGGSVVMLTDESARVLGYVDLYRADAMLATPALLSQIVTLPDAAQFLTGLRDIRVGGALLAQSLITSLAAITPARLHLGYGASEIGLIFGFVYDRDNPQPEGYLGRCLNDQITVTLHAEDGTPLPDDAPQGTVGVRVNDPALRRRYLRPTDAGASDTPDEQDEMLFPGDVLRRDATGYHFVGRTRNIVNFGGDKYSLDLIAAHLYAVFQGRMVVPLVETDAQGIEGLVLVSAGIEPVDEKRAQEALRERFGNARVLRCETVHEIPMTDTGKVDSIRLRALMRGH